MYCFHCGEKCILEDYEFEDKNFCCLGCKTVYQILKDNNLGNYYHYNEFPGTSQNKPELRFHYLEEASIIRSLLDFQNDSYSLISFYIPQIHCSSCLWLLEKLNQINPNILYSRVDFLKKQVNIRFDHNSLSLRDLVELLAKIGYEPKIQLQDSLRKEDRGKDPLILKIAVAGFCFGNIMLLSFPEYFGLKSTEKAFHNFFGYLNLLLCLPIVFYSGWDYFRSSWNQVKTKSLQIDFPLALGILVLFLRSFIEIIWDKGSGFSDTLSGLVFFLLIGKFVQQKTYHHISFERDYRSFFPISVALFDGIKYKPIPLSALKIGDRILIRNQEIIPADSILIQGEAQIDFGFVTGETSLQEKKSGELIYAGGKQTGGAIELEVVKSVSQSYLTQLWNQDLFKKESHDLFRTFSAKISQYFTWVLFGIACLVFLFWAFQDISLAISAFTAVLIVACPCALALSTPFTMSSALRILDRNGFYLKNTQSVEQLAEVNTLVFDKTGTLTSEIHKSIQIEPDLSSEEKNWVSSLCANSIHPLSRRIWNHYGQHKPEKIVAYKEIEGLGVKAQIQGHSIKLGSSSFIELSDKTPSYLSQVHLEIDGYYRGFYGFKNEYREGLQALNSLKKDYPIYLLSGDRDHELPFLSSIFKPDREMYFDQSPMDKLAFIGNLQKESKQVLMIGDGLNDSGALKKADFGISVTDNIDNFTPGSDAILEGNSFKKLSQFLLFSKDCVHIIHYCFGLSLIYNIIGLSMAITGKLSPLMAAILMPLSTLTIISFTSLGTTYAGFKRKLL